MALFGFDIPIATLLNPLLLTPIKVLDLVRRNRSVSEDATMVWLAPVEWPLMTCLFDTTFIGFNKKVSLSSACLLSVATNTALLDCGLFLVNMDLINLDTDPNCLSVII